MIGSTACIGSTDMFCKCSNVSYQCNPGVEVPGTKGPTWHTHAGAASKRQRAPGAESHSMGALVAAYGSKRCEFQDASIPCCFTLASETAAGSHGLCSPSKCKIAACFR